MALTAREVAMRRLAQGADGPMDLSPPDEEIGAYLAERAPYTQPLNRPAAFATDDAGEIVQMDAAAGDRARAAGRETLGETEAMARRAPIFVDDGAGGVVQTTGANAGGRPQVDEGQARIRLSALEQLSSSGAASLVPTINPETGEMESMPEADARAAGRIIVPKEEATSAFSTRRTSAAIDGADDASLFAGTRLLPNDPRLAAPKQTPSTPRAARRAAPPMAERTMRASVATPTQLPVPEVGAQRAAVPAAPPAPVVDDLANAQDEARQRRLYAGIGQAADFVSASISGSKPQGAFYERLSGEADQPVRDYLAAKQQKEQAAKAAEAAALKDPNPDASKRFQVAVARTLPGVYSPEDIALMSASDAEQVTKMGEMRATLNAREEEQAARATAQATENDAQRTFQAGESQKQRALQRELAAQRSDRTQDGRDTKEQQRIFKNEGDLRRELNSNPATKDFQGVSVAFDKVQRAAQDPSAAGDLSLIFGFMKMLDPGSTVREGEFANAQNAGGVGDRIAASYNKVLNGERLTDAQRADFIRQARGAYEAQKSAYDRVAGGFRLAAQEAGVSPDRVAMPIGLDLAAPQAAAPQAASGRNQAALDWAAANPTDPRAAEIRARLGAR